APAATESSPEIETLYLEGTTAPGAAAGKRFPTPSGKLEFFTDALERKFQAVGLSALPEFYSEREQLLDLPHLELLDTDADEGVISPFTSPATWSARARLVAASADGPGARLRAQGFDTELITGRPPAAHFHSMTHYLWQAQEMWPDLYCQLHPEKAARLGIADGERLRSKPRMVRSKRLPGSARAFGPPQCSCRSAGANASPTIRGARSTSSRTRTSAIRCRTRPT
ncbi:MAG: hypothetical protein IPM01_26925, partial [Burkholderiaceae bacterium]|nr:hypothetical protein [Burkholderiaceae bacterium]